MAILSLSIMIKEDLNLYNRLSAHSQDKILISLSLLKTASQIDYLKL